MCEIDKQDFINTVAGLSAVNEEKVMTLAEQFRQEGRQEGLQEGKAEAFSAVAMRLLIRGLSIEQIAAVTGLTSEEIKLLKNKSSH